MIRCTVLFSVFVILWQGDRIQGGLVLNGFDIGHDTDLGGGDLIYKIEETNDEASKGDGSFKIGDFDFKNFDLKSFDIKNFDIKNFDFKNLDIKNLDIKGPENQRPNTAAYIKPDDDTEAGPNYVSAHSFSSSSPGGHVTSSVCTEKTGCVVHSSDGDETPPAETTGLSPGISTVPIQLSIPFDLSKFGLGDNLGKIVLNLTADPSKGGAACDGNKCTYNLFASAGFTQDSTGPVKN